MKTLTKKNFSYNDVISFGNMFLLGNGRYGYRGTLEEYRKDEMTGLNMLGVYDQYQDKWRESINLPNPFYIYIKDHSILEDGYESHEISLDIENGVFSRLTKYKDIVIKSTRFVSSDNKEALANRYIIKALADTSFDITLGLDLDIYEINGPHFTNKKCDRSNNKVRFVGNTNEGKILQISAKYEIKGASLNEYFQDDIYGYLARINLKKDEECTIDIIAQIKGDNLLDSSFEELFQSHKSAFIKQWDNAYVEIKGDEEAQFELDYSIYHLLILQDNESLASVPARGLSGQTYKGAIFWDTEMFMLPFYVFTNPAFARNLIRYRINTLEGAKKKAKKYGYEGAFFAWESQEDGIEQCSDYNVTDPITNKPIRTYFADKQIHISADIALALTRYVRATEDYSIFEEGGYELLYESIEFYLSYLTKEEKYHLNDVIGPDEYHERVNDNAYTNMIVENILELGIRYYDQYINTVKEKTVSKENMIDVLNHLYIHEPNKEGIIEQFNGYFSLEDVLPDEVKNRKKSDKEYMGGANGVATKTRVIKQADVLAELIMLNHSYDNEILRKNYEYYSKYTEHGSSLSASMYCLAACSINKLDEAYALFRKSSGIDLGTNQKMYAGGIYIGGTHPASNAGAYLSVIFGFSGLIITDEGISFKPHIPPSIEGIEYKMFYKNKQYHVEVFKDNSYSLKEVKDND